MACRFTAEEFFGITIHAGTPRHAAAQATAAPWLPLDCVTMPWRTSSSVSEKIALEAPRILNEPVFCKFSHFKKTRAPTSLSSDDEVMIGARWMRGAMRACAAWTRLPGDGRWQFVFHR